MARPRAPCLELKPLEPADGERVYRALESSRAQLRRRLAWAAAATEQSCRDIAARAGAYGLIELKTGELVGAAELRAGEDVPAEVSGWVRSDRVERGYATEAGRLLAARAFRRLGLHKLCARIDPANRAARKVLRRLGFRYEGCLRKQARLNGRWVDQECWGLLRDEWKP